MTLSKAEMLTQVVDALKEIGDENDIAIDMTTNPMKSLGLDSGHGPTFACEMEVRLSIKIDDEINPLVADEPQRRSRTVGEIVDLLLDLCKKQEVQK